MRVLGGALVVLAAWLAVPSAAAARPPFHPGAAGIGDPYFPLAGNGGYDVRHYGLDLRYDPSTDRLSGTATIRATATTNLSRFNLDFVGMDVRDVAVDGRPATWRRARRHELIVRPATGLPKARRFTVVVAYDGVPRTRGAPRPGNQSGFIHTDDGAMVVGEIESAPTWFPVNDHPSDKASYTFRWTVPLGLEAVANGVLEGAVTHGDSTTWTWDAREPMAPYLTTAAIGHFNLRSREAAGIRYWHAIDPDLFTPTPVPRTGTQFAISQSASSAYQRLARTIDVPADGGRLSFWVDRDTEPSFDFMFVEAHTVGADDWTMLRDRRGHTRANPRFCEGLLAVHPFLAHYATAGDDGRCTAEGSSGAWWAATGASDGYERWVVDLSAYAGKRVEVAIAVVTDEAISHAGAVVDDVVGPGGAGSTSFEADGDPLDGWQVPGAPPGSPGNAADWIVGGAGDVPPSTGGLAQAMLDREPEMIRFLARRFGPYPFTASGGIFDDTDRFGFALETQTRPVFSRLLFEHPARPVDPIVVHELAHQWFGDDLGLKRWRHIWLSEGFATYAEWLWNEHVGRETAQQTFDDVMSRPADDEFWQVVIGDPGVDALFDTPIYARGAATLHALRLELGDRAFFRVLHRWTRSRSRGTVTTAGFVALAERVSGRDLGAFFERWLFTRAKPVG